MKLPALHSTWPLSVIPAFALLLTPLANAQNCNLPTVPNGTITTTQDRDQMMCQQNLTFPALPVRAGSSWPWNDPTAPTNAWPKTLATPEGNWTDAQSHTIVRTAWGNWHTYDAASQYEPQPSLHYPDPSIVTGPTNGGANERRWHLRSGYTGLSAASSAEAGWRQHDRQEGRLVDQATSADLSERAGGAVRNVSEGLQTEYRVDHKRDNHGNPDRKRWQPLRLPGQNIHWNRRYL